MNVDERKRLEAIPSKIDHNEILNLVTYSSSADNQLDFILLKSISNVDDREISHWLDINEKTYRSYKNTIKESKPLLSEHVIMLIALFKHGLKIYGTAGHFTKWLEKKNFFFDQKAPIEFINTLSGIKFIDDRLTGIEYGDNA